MLIRIILVLLAPWILFLLMILWLLSPFIEIPVASVKFLFTGKISSDFTDRISSYIEYFMKSCMKSLKKYEIIT